MSRDKNRSWGGLRSIHPRSRAEVEGPSPPQGGHIRSRTSSTGVAELRGVGSDDGTELPPGSPSTPPKKVWEEKYKSFLHRRKQKDCSNSSMGDSSASSLDSRTFIPPKKNGALHMNNSNSNSNNDLETATTALPPLALRSNHRRIGSSGSGRSLHLQTKGANALEKSNDEGEDSSVRGGSLFKQMFKRDKDNNSTPRTNRKSVSADELDGTLRRGVDKAYSPSTPQRTLIPQPMPATRSLSHGSALHGHHNVRTIHATAGGHGVSPSSVQIHESHGFNLGDSNTKRPLIAAEDEYDFGIPLPIAVSEPAMPLHHEPVVQSGPFPSSHHQTEQKADSDELNISVRKKAFTEFHNAPDSDSPFLGDDYSRYQFRTSGLWTPTQRTKLGTGHVSHGDLILQRKTSHQLVPVPENIAITKQRMLRPFLGVEEWQAGRRYLIGPAALAACPVDSVSSSALLDKQALAGASQFAAPQAAEADASAVSGSILLGNCLLSYTLTGNASITAKTWSRSSLVLRKNYLLEFDQDFVYKGEPRGYVHLEGAQARPHPDFADALELDFFGSPCSKSDLRKLVIRLAERSERDACVACLNRAAALRVEDLYDVDKSIELGGGRYSTVRRATVRGTNKSVSLKIFEKSSFWKLVVKGRERADTLVREAAVQATLTAKCKSAAPFLELRGFLETSQQVVLELELLGGLDLFQYISLKRGVIEESEAAHILADILKCLVAMNGIGVAHRDVKPANVLMCDSQKGTDANTPRVKVCDFGMATFVGVDGHIRGRCGTPGYVAPEIFTTGLHGGYGNQVDVFSAGVTLYVMLCGYEPFYGETDEELVEANRLALVDFPDEDWKTVSIEARDIVQKLMEKDPQKRLTAKDALEHVWFQKHKIT